VLDSVFHFDNSAFENQLRQRGFHFVENSFSNYNYTAFSVASTLNMSYLNDIKGQNSDRQDMKTCFDTINNNAVKSFLEQTGYRFYNYSLFDFDGQPSEATPAFLPTKTKPIISQTFLYRVQRDLWYHIVTDLKSESSYRKLLYMTGKNNKRLYELTRQTAIQKKTEPKFVYTHLVMPHYPYYSDSTGKERPFEKITDANATDTAAFISYLKYANKKLLELTDTIIQSSLTAPIIILLSDHGFREFGFNTEMKYHFSTLNAILLPEKNYTGFYNGMSHVNLFRVLLNTQFRQNLPLLKDSTRLIVE
jgi:Sulfatase